VTPERRLQLLAFLASLALDPETAEPEAIARLEVVEEALTHTSARRGWNHERLEFLGDAVLRLAAAEFLEQYHGRLTVGQRSALRAQLVSDRWLAALGERCGIDQVWLIGPMAAGDRAGRATVRAELSEALIGAIYLTWGGARGGLLAVATWLTPHWQHTSRELLEDPDRHNWKSALQEWSQGRGLGLPQYLSEQVSSEHGDPRRYRCTVSLQVDAPPAAAKSSLAWGPSRRTAEQEAARQLLAALRPAAAG
jgi:ribonuclease-3